MKIRIKLLLISKKEKKKGLEHSSSRDPKNLSDFGEA